MRYILPAAAFLVIYSVVGTADHNDAVQAENNYTKMVCDGLWPNYKNLTVSCDNPTSPLSPTWEE